MNEENKSTEARSLVNAHELVVAFENTGYILGLILPTAEG